MDCDILDGEWVNQYRTHLAAAAGKLQGLLPSVLWSLLVLFVRPGLELPRRDGDHSLCGLEVLTDCARSLFLSIPFADTL